MPNPAKIEAVAHIKERLENAQAVFLAEYAGIPVSSQQKLRRDLKATGAEFKVVKMTLARLAAAELEIDSLDELLKGPTGLAIADGDPVAAARVIKDFAKANDVFQIKGGLLGFDYLSPERVSELAAVESREVLLSQLAGVFSAPMANVLGLLEAAPRDVVGLVAALIDKLEAGGETVSAEVAGDQSSGVAVEKPDDVSADSADAETDTKESANESPAESSDSGEEGSTNEAEEE